MRKAIKTLLTCERRSPSPPPPPPPRDDDEFPESGAHRYPREGEDQLFSDDETQNKFISDITWIKDDHWIHSEMKWNAIHGIFWARMNLIGEGSFGSVFVGIRTDKKLFAVKSIPIDYPLDVPDQYRMKKQINEIKMLRYLRSKYVVRFLGCGRSKGVNAIDGDPALDVFLEFAPRGSLTDIYKQRGKVPLEEDPYIRQYTYDLLKGLQYLQKKKVVHGDIKCGNILLTDDCVKFTDFGGSKQVNETNLKKFLTGTLNYLAPEAISRKDTQSYPSDIFSLGCTVIQMATGRGPKRVDAKVKGHELLNNPIHSKEILIPPHLSAVCKDFLNQCLYEDPQKRWTAAELLHHPFITGRDKTNRLPYSMAVPEGIRATLLQPPRQLDPELPDEPVTLRVYNHLCRVNRGWAANLAGCSTLVIPPSHETAKVSAAGPLPPLAPGDKNNEYPSNMLGWLATKNPVYEEGRARRYMSPENSQRLIVPTPVSSPDRPPAAIKRVPPTEAPNREMGRLAVTEGRFTKIPPKETHDEMLNTFTVMREANNDIFKSATSAAGDIDRSIAQELFPQLKEPLQRDSRPGPSQSKLKGKMPR